MNDVLCLSTWWWGVRRGRWRMETNCFLSCSNLDKSIRGGGAVEARWGIGTIPRIDVFVCHETSCGHLDTPLTVIYIFTVICRRK